MRFVDLKLKIKFFWAFALFILITLFLSLNSIYSLRRFEKSFKSLASEIIPEIHFANNVTSHTRRAAYSVQGYMLTGSSAYYERGTEELDTLSRDLRESKQILQRESSNSTLLSRIEGAETLLARYRELIDEVRQLRENEMEIREQLERSGSAYMEQCRNFLSLNENRLRQEIVRGVAANTRTSILSLTGGLLDVGHRINVYVKTLGLEHTETLPEDRQVFFDEMDRNIVLLKSYVRGDVAWIENLEKAAAVYKGDVNKLIDNQKNKEVLYSLHQERSEELISKAVRLREGVLSDASGTAEKFSGTSMRSILTNLIVVLAAVAVALFTAVYISRQVTKPLKRGVDFAQSITRGDLTARLEVDQKDEIGDLASNLQHMSEIMRQTIAAVTTAADNMANASMELSSTSQTVSQGASEQASSAEEVSSAIEEMAASIQQNAENARTTEKIAAHVEKDIIDGKEKVVRTVNAIKEIADKISIIGDIAFQTNILALNAAVEAARAGEHGRGFGVVAAEVGKLAERSKIAAQDIDRLTRVSVSSAEDAGLIMNQIVPEIQKTADLIRQIVVAGAQQHAGADQINVAIQQLNQVTQQNAAASEELATNAVELSAQAENLQKSVSFFKVVKNEGTGKVIAGYQRPVSKSKGIKPRLKKGVILNLDDDSDNEFERF